MADVQIKNIGTTQTTINDSDWFVLQDGVSSVTKKVSASIMRSYANPSYITGLSVPNTITYNGEGCYDLVFNSTDLTSLLSHGMRMRIARSVTAPIQCTSLNGTTQYYSKTSPNKLTATDDIVLSAWIKLSSYGSASIISRYNGTSGFDFRVGSTGQLILEAYNAGAANFSNVSSYRSIPLNRWVHVTAQLDMSTFTATSTTSYIMINGIDVPATVSRGGTNPTAFIQAGNLEIGSKNGGTTPFPGKIAQAAIFNAKVTQATIRTYVSQGLAGNETSLASAYSFNNSIADLNTTTPNDLTASGSAVATNADSPFTQNEVGTPGGTYDYAVITKKAFSTNTTLTVQVPEGCMIPTSGGTSSIVYSSTPVPYGFPSQKQRWSIIALLRTDYNQATPVSGTVYNLGGLKLNAPVGSWNARGEAYAMGRITAAGAISVSAGLSTSSSTLSDTEALGTSEVSSQATLTVDATVFKDLDLTTATDYYINASVTGTAPTNLDMYGARNAAKIQLDNAYI